MLEEISNGLYIIRRFVSYLRFRFAETFSSSSRLEAASWGDVTVRDCTYFATCARRSSVIIICRGYRAVAYGNEDSM